MKKYFIMILTLAMLSVGLTLNAEEAPSQAIFAGGCFWCMQADFDKVPGVIKTVAGYTGGHLPNPDYQTVTQQTTGHYEAIEVYYDSQKVDYATLLNHFWHNIDPLDEGGQFCDKGPSYRAAIFYLNEAQKVLAQKSKTQIMKQYKLPHIVTVILPARTFYPAEDYHQSYYLKNAWRYQFYRHHCGRDARLKEVWSKKN